MLEEIESLQIMGKIENGVGHEHLVVEMQDVVADHEIGFAQTVYQVAGSPFGINLVGVLSRALGDPHRHPHLIFLVPTAHVVGRALGLQVKVNDVHRQGWRMGKNRCSFNS